jgi:nucleotide-binding universal stress UspA family protein
MAKSDIMHVLVHVDDDEDVSGARVDLAAAVSDRFGAVLTGAAAARPFLPAYAPFAEEFVAMQPVVYQAAERQVTLGLERAEALFRSHAPRDARWQSSDRMDAIDFLPMLASGADLLVVGSDPAEKAPTLFNLSASDILMTAGRPVMIAPRGIKHLSARQIVVGWKDAPEARRAVRDALPFLGSADEVFIVGAGPETPSSALERVTAYLKARGINAKPVTEELGSGRASAALLRVAQRVNADLIVAGAFGHSRFREWALGGVTRDLIASMPVCCMLSR